MNASVLCWGIVERTAMRDHWNDWHQFVNIDHKNVQVNDWVGLAVYSRSRAIFFHLRVCLYNIIICGIIVSLMCLYTISYISRIARSPDAQNVRLQSHTYVITRDKRFESIIPKSKQQVGLHANYGLHCGLVYKTLIVVIIKEIN